MIQQKRGNAATGGPGITSKIRKKLDKVCWLETNTKLLRVVCGMVLGGILVAGLWPFHSPKNEVKWLPSSNGLCFGLHGMIRSSGNSAATKVSARAPCSLEIWFEPSSTEASGTLFAFYAPGKPRQFSLQQSISDLCLRSSMGDGRHRTRADRLYVDDIFRQGKPLFVTITSNGARVSVYVDGALARTAPKFPLSSQDFDGELVINNSPVFGNSWSGLLRGLAFYDQELSPAEVVHHYQTWAEKGRPDVSESERAMGLYLFNERAGNVVHNLVPSGTDLYVPERYQVVDQVFLEPFWEEFDLSWGYWRDVLVNIAGFVPFGFLFCAYFSLAGRIKRPALVTILLGFMLSLTIESLQSFLPTRDSGTTDLITNTLGTCYGVWLYRLKLW